MAARIDYTIFAFASCLNCVPRYRIQRTRLACPSACTKLNLLPAERTPFLLLSPGPTTVTFFKGNAARVRPQLEKRITKVLDCNSWLGAYLQGGGAYYPSKSRLEHHFSVKYNLSVRQTSTSFVQLLRRIAPARCDAAAITNSRAPLWRVTLVPAGAERFAVIMSACHLLLDARGLYTVADMILGSAQVRKLNPTRQPDVFPRTPATAGLTHSLDIISALSNPSFSTLSGAFTRLVQGGARGLITGDISAMAIEVSESWVRTQKQSAIARGAEFVSTNDVVTSELLKCDGSQPYDMAFMAVDLRGRVSENKADQIGNYVGFMYYSPNDYVLPENIRNSLSGDVSQRINVPRSNLQSPLEHAVRGRYAIVSNWAGFGITSNVEDATAELHVAAMDLPVSDIASYMIIFQTAPGKVGVAIHAAQKILNAIGKSDMVGRVLQMPM